MPSFETAARSLKVEAITAPVHDEVEIETAIIALEREPGGGLVVTADAFVFDSPHWHSATRCPRVRVATVLRPAA
jgi:hypothetical protein